MRRIKLLPMLSAVLKKWWDDTNPMRDSVRRLTMKKSRIIVRTALATTLILIVAPVVFAWEPDLLSAPHRKHTISPGVTMVSGIWNNTTWILSLI